MNVSGSSSASTAPHQLHLLLARVRDSGEGCLRDGWVKALGANYGSIGFARRHAEAVALLVETIEQLHALPDRARDRSLRYVPQWWRAVVSPDGSWVDTGYPARNAIDDASFDQLEAAADIVAANLPGSTAAPNGADLSILQEQCLEWIHILEGADGQQLAVGVKNEILGQLRHIIWLIENVELFGSARVSREASRVIGSLTQASASLGDSSPESRSRWKKAWYGLIAAFIAFTSGATVVQEAISAGEGVLKEIDGLIK